MTIKNSINLLQPELLPDVPLLSLNRAAAISVLTLALMSLWTFISHSQLSQVKEQHQSLTLVKAKATTQLAALELKVSRHQKDPALVAKLTALKLLIDNKQALHGQLTHTEHTYVAGFSTAMTELSQLDHPDVSLQHINISNDELTFIGLAKRPESVPAWLAGFEHSALLSGKSFLNFKLTENEQQLTKFVVSSKFENKEL